MFIGGVKTVRLRCVRLCGDPAFINCGIRQYYGIYLIQCISSRVVVKVVNCPIV
jgi:hypothetical protein